MIKIITVTYQYLHRKLLNENQLFLLHDILTQPKTSIQFKPRRNSVHNITSKSYHGCQATKTDKNENMWY